MTEQLLRSDQGLRIESLGDNCELGFVMRRIGHDSGSLFRWASMKPHSLLAMLRADLTGFYRFEDLSPLRAAMVCDDAYGIGWHSDMRCHAVGGRMAFVDDRPTRLAIHLREQRKLRYLVAKFRARASLGGVLFVIKSNPGIEPGLIDTLFAQLQRLAGGAVFTLLEVQAAPEPDRIGQVERRRDGLLRGYVSGFASYETADKMDFAAWSAVLDNALSMESSPGWTARLSQLHVEVVENAISLPFPPAADADLSRPLIGDLRGGAVRLLHGNEWCRPVDGAYRLHGPSPEHKAAQLYWANLRGAGRHQLVGTVHCPILDSVPLNLVIQAIDGAGKVCSQQRLTVAPGGQKELFMQFVLGQATDLLLEAQAARPLKTGERCVVDLGGLMLSPVADPAVAQAA